MKFTFVLIVAVFIFLVTFVVPQFETTLMQLNVELPWITQVVIGISQFFTYFGFLILVATISIILLLWIWFQTKSGKRFKDLMKLHIPIIRKISYFLITTRFSRGLSVLVSSGMNVMTSIELIGKLMDNEVFEENFQYVVDEIKRGKRIHRSIEHIKFFPRMLVEMINVGESTGNLDEVLEITSDYYDEQLEQSIQRASQMIEPLMIVLAGILVGVVVLAIFLPMISIMGGI